jgi:hypothetical protein
MSKTRNRSRAGIMTARNIGKVGGVLLAVAVRAMPTSAAENEGVRLLEPAELPMSCETEEPGLCESKTG